MTDVTETPAPPQRLQISLSAIFLSVVVASTWFAAWKICPDVVMPFGAQIVIVAALLVWFFGGTLLKQAVMTVLVAIILVTPVAFLALISSEGVTLTFSRVDGPFQSLQTAFRGSLILAVPALVILGWIEHRRRAHGLPQLRTAVQACMLTILGIGIAWSAATVTTLGILSSLIAMAHSILTMYYCSQMGRWLAKPPPELS